MSGTLILCILLLVGVVVGALLLWLLTHPLD